MPTPKLVAMALFLELESVWLTAEEVSGPERKTVVMIGTGRLVIVSPALLVAETLRALIAVALMVAVALPMGQGKRISLIGTLVPEGPGL